MQCCPKFEIKSFNLFAGANVSTGTYGMPANWQAVKAMIASIDFGILITAGVFISLDRSCMARFSLYRNNSEKVTDSRVSFY